VRISALRLGIALVLISGTVAFASLSADGQRAEAPAAKAAGKGAPHIRARGKVNGLYPGAVKKMRVRIRNRFPDPVRLRYVRTKARDAGPGCGMENLVVPAKRRTRARIRPHSRRTVKVKVKMVADAADACQGARFPLRFRVRGKRR
jgi:hypothetical protein